jgi:hypothetical protein
MSTSWNNVDPQIKAGFDALSGVVSQAGGILTLTSTIRSFKEQSYLYDRYTKGLSALPANPPGHSAHEWGLAFDAIVAPGDWIWDVASVWKDWGGTHGGKRDPVHFELRGAGKLAWDLGEQGITPPWYSDAGSGAALDEGATGGHKKGIAALVSRLSPFWQRHIYTIPDVALGFVPYVDVAMFVASLIQIGYKKSEIINFLAEPIEDLHAKFPEYI